MNNSKEIPQHAPEEFNGAKLLGIHETGTTEWHAMRETGIGGSEIGTIMGLNPWESAFALWAKKTGQIPNPPVDNWSVRFGKAFEEPILRMWQEQNPRWEVFTTGTYQHKDIPYMHANPDALARDTETGDWMIVEIKTARSPWTTTPPAYEAQVLHYMDVMQINYGMIVAVAGWTWEERPVDWDPWQLDAQREAARRFWEHLQNQIKPGWDGSKATYEAERQLHPDIEDQEVELGDLGLQLLDAQEQHEEAEKHLLAIKAEVLDTMGSAKHGLVTLDGETRRVAARQARGQGTPWLVIKRDK